jgi:hypothetical protein
MTDEAKGPDGQHWWPGCAGALLLGLAALYVLSAGPAVAVYHWTAGAEGGAVVNTVYAPVWWLRDNTPLRKPLEAYLRLWR